MSNQDERDIELYYSFIKIKQRVDSATLFIYKDYTGNSRAIPVTAKAIF